VTPASSVTPPTAVRRVSQRAHRPLFGCTKRSDRRVLPRPWADMSGEPRGRLTRGRRVTVLQSQTDPLVGSYLLFSMTTRAALITGPRAGRGLRSRRLLAQTATGSRSCRARQSRAPRGGGRALHVSVINMASLVGLAGMAGCRSTRLARAPSLHSRRRLTENSDQPAPSRPLRPSYLDTALSDFARKFLPAEIRSRSSRWPGRCCASHRGRLRR
jgi:hypothetical protein